MPGGFPIGPEICNGYAIGTVTTGSTGTTITPSATDNVKGSYTQLIASVPYDLSYVMVSIGAQSVTNGCCDIAVGASGSEEVIISNLVIPINNGYVTNIYSFPLSIPAGSRVAARAQAVNGNAGSSRVSLVGFGGAYSQWEGAAGVDAIGFNTSTSLGTAVTPSATANIKGSYIQLTAATNRDYIGIFGVQGGGSSGFSDWYMMDIAVGASGSELAIVPNFWGSSYYYAASPILFLPIPIPAGTRIAARCQCSVASGLAIDMTLYGVYL